MSRMSEMSHASQDYCNENYGPQDIPQSEADCPCGGWDCSGSPGGPLLNCPYFEPRQVQAKSWDHGMVGSSLADWCQTNPSSAAQLIERLRDESRRQATPAD